MKPQAPPPTLAELQAQIETLQETIRLLTEPEESIIFPASLNKLERVLLSALYARREVSFDLALTLMNSITRKETATNGAVVVQIYHLRKKIAPLKILSIYGVGYALSEEAKSIIKRDWKETDPKGPSQCQKPD